MINRADEAKRRIRVRNPELDIQSKGFQSLLSAELKRMSKLSDEELARRQSIELAHKPSEENRLPALSESVVADLYAALKEGRKKSEIPGLIAAARKEDPDATTAQELLALIWRSKARKPSR